MSEASPPDPEPSLSAGPTGTEPTLAGAAPTTAGGSAAPLPATPALPVSPPEILDDPLLAALPVVDGSKRLGTCILTAKLGQGGMGAVYRGFHTRLNTPVAVKILPFHLATGPNAEAARQRFHREAQLTVQLDHPNLIRVMDVDESDQRMYYLIMEYVEGQTVGSALRRHLEKHNRPLPERTAVSVVAQVASAITYAHQKGIIHRDIKPDNIMIRKDDGRVKVMDLGLAKTLDADEGVSMTSQGMGSPHYMSPEQASDAKHVTEASDVYSIGATLYHLVTGHTAFQAPSIYALVKKMHDEPPEDPRTYNPTLSDELRTVILRCLDKDPAKRFTAAELFKILRAVGEKLPANPPAHVAAGTVSATANTLPSTATVAAPGASAPAPVAAPSALGARTQTTPVRPATRKAAGPVAPQAGVAAKPSRPPGSSAAAAAAAERGGPHPNRRLLFIALGAGGGLLLLALIVFAWMHHANAVAAQARAEAVDGILKQIEPRLAVRDYDQASALFKTIPPDADPAQIAATRQAVDAGVAARAGELEFLHAVDAKIHQSFEAFGQAPGRPAIQPVTHIEPVDATHDLTPQLRLEIDIKPTVKLDGKIHPAARADLQVGIDDGELFNHLQLSFRDRPGLLDYLDVLGADLAPGDPAFGERLVRLSQNRFRKIFWLMQQKGDDGTVASGTELQLAVELDGNLTVKGHSVKLPDITAVLRELDGGDNSPVGRPRPGERGERGERKGAQKFSGSARLIAGDSAPAQGPRVDGFSRLLAILEKVSGKTEPNYPNLARELTATVADVQVTLDQTGRQINRVDFSAQPAEQSGLTLRAQAVAENRIAYQMLERLIPRLLFWMSIDPKNTNLMTVDRETDPAKMQSALVLHFNNAGVQKMLKDMWAGNPYNKQP